MLTNERQKRFRRDKETFVMAVVARAAKGKHTLGHSNQRVPANGINRAGEPLFSG